MDSRIKERCIYCGGDVYYHGDESLIKCDWCGQTIPVMKFQGQITRMKKTAEENALIKEQLKEAEKEKKAAEQGDAVAQLNLGNGYYFGNGVEKDLKQAVYWYQKAADQGYEDAKAKVKQLTKKKR